MECAYRNFSVPRNSGRNFHESSEDIQGCSFGVLGVLTSRELIAPCFVFKVQFHNLERFTMKSKSFASQHCDLGSSIKKPFTLRESWEALVLGLLFAFPFIVEIFKSIL